MIIKSMAVSITLVDIKHFKIGLSYKFVKRKWPTYNSNFITQLPTGLRY